jgi:hypothetical protein
MPLVDLGLINLVPDPCNFDFHLRQEMMRMARGRSAGIRHDPSREPRLKKLMEEDMRRSIMLMPRDAMRAKLRKLNPELDEEMIEITLRHGDRLREDDPLAVLQEDSLNGTGGQASMFKLLPNFEITMYLAQATGGCIVTDSPFRWAEIKRASRAQAATTGLATLAGDIGRTKFAFPQNVTDTTALALSKTFAGYPALFRDLFKYLSHVGDRGQKINREAQLIGRFAKAHALAQDEVKKMAIDVKEARISCAFPPGGIQVNAVNRLLLMSSSERHLPSVPMAYFIKA